MPLVTKDINELHNSVSRPVALSLLRHVMKLTGIPQATPTLYLGDSGAAVLEGATVEGSNQPTRFTTNNKVFIEVTDELVAEDNITRYTHQFEQRPIFHDPALNFTIFPIYAKSQMTISIRYRTEDKPTAERWRNGLARKLSQGMMYHLHEPEYHYIIPDEILGLLVEIYRKREAQHGYGDALKDYIKQNMRKRATTLTTQVGTQGKLAILEKLLQVVGRFDTDNPAKEEKEQTGAVWLAQIDYVLEYDRPISIVARYPISVHSQVIDPIFWPKPAVPYTLDYIQATSAASLNALQRVALSQQPNKHNPSWEGYLYPPGDDWMPSKRYRACVFIGRFLMVPGEDKRTLGNLTDLGEATLNEAVVKYLKKWPQYGTVSRESPVFVRVYEQNEELADQEFHLTPDLDIKLKYDCDHRKVYHMTISLLTDLTLLSPDAKDRVTKDPDLVDVIVPPGKPDVDTGGNVTPDWWDKHTRPDKKKDDELVRRTVSHYYLITHRKEELKQ